MPARGEGHEDLARSQMAAIEPVGRTAVRVLGQAGGSVARAAGEGDAGQFAQWAAAGLRLAQDAMSIALMTEDSRTRFKGKPGRRKAVAWNEPLPIDEVKAVCRALGVSVNDVLLSCVAGALRRYLAERGDATEGVELRAMVPVNLRPPQQEARLGNRFGLGPLVLPVGIANPRARLRESA